VVWQRNWKYRLLYQKDSGGETILTKPGTMSILGPVRVDNANCTREIKSTEMKQAIDNEKETEHRADRAV